MYKSKFTSRTLTEEEYWNLPSYLRQDYQKCDNGGNFLMSAVIGAVTDSALLGGMVGGDLLGGLVGDLLDGSLFD